MLNLSIEQIGDIVILDFNNDYKTSSLIKYFAYLQNIKLNFEENNNNASKGYITWSDNKYKLNNFFMEIEKKIKLNFENKELTNKLKKEFLNSKTRRVNLQNNIDDVFSERKKVNVLNLKLLKNKSISPFTFQRDQALLTISNLRYCNFSSPGAGKTFTTIIHILHLVAEEKIKNVFILGPKSAIYTWKDHFTNLISDKYSEFLDLSDMKKDKIKSLSIWNQQRNLLSFYFINFHKMDDQEIVSNFITKATEEKFSNSILIIDECHYLKNSDTVKHKNIARLSEYMFSTILLSGTPLPRGIEEGIYIFNLLWPNVYQSKIEQKNLEEYNILENKDKDKIKVKEIFKKIFVRKDKNELVHQNLLEKLEIKIVDFQMNELEKIIRTSIPELENNKMDQLILENWNKAFWIRAMQASSYPLLLRKDLKESIEEFEEDIKKDNPEVDDFKLTEDFWSISSNNKRELKILETKLENVINSSQVKRILDIFKIEDNLRYIKAKEIIESLENERIIVWDVFRSSMTAFQKFLSNLDRKIWIINGKLDVEKRSLFLHKFRKSKNGILIASAATIAESISLHEEVDYAIYLYRNFVGSHWMQSQDRIHRLVSPDKISRKKTIYILKSTAKNEFDIKKSIDDIIDENLDNKVKIQSEILK